MGAKSAMKTKAAQDGAEARKRSGARAGGRVVKSARRGRSSPTGGTSGGVSEARTARGLTENGAKKSHDATKRINPSIEAKMELEAFLGNTQSVVAVELASREAEDVFEPDLGILNPFAPPKMASFTLQSLVDPPADLLPTATGTSLTSADVMFDSWAVVDVCGQGADPFTNTSTPRCMPELGPASTTLFGTNQSEYGAFLGSPGYNTTVNANLILFGSIRDEVERQWQESGSKTNRRSAADSTKSKVQGLSSDAGNDAGQKVAKRRAKVSPQKHLPTKMTKVSPERERQEDTDAQQKVAKAHKQRKDGVENPSSLLPSVQLKSARRAGNVSALTPQHPSRELSGSTATSLSLPGGVHAKSQPVNNSLPSSSLSDDEKKAIGTLMEVIIQIPEATRENVRKSLLRLKKSVKLCDGKLRSAIEDDPDTNYIDRSVANLLYHRYSVEGLPGLTSNNALAAGVSSREVNSATHERWDGLPAVPA